MPKALDFLAKAAAFADRHVYAVVGEEEYLRDEVVAALLAMLEAAHGTLDIERLDGDRLNGTAQLFDHIRGRGLFGGTTVVLLSDRRGEKQNFVPRHNDELTEYVAKPARSGILVLLLPKLRKNFRVSKAIERHGVRIDADPLFAPQRAAFVAREARARGVTFAADAAEHLDALAGPSLARLTLEIEKLALYLGAEGGPITPAIVDTALGYRGTSTVWLLLDAALGGDLPAALGHLADVRAAGQDYNQILGALVWRLKTLWVARAALDAGASDYDAARRANQHRNPRPFIAQVRRHPLAAYAALHRELLATDAEAKSSGVPPEILLERLVIRLAAAPNLAG